MSRITDHEPAESLPSDRWVFPVRKGFALLWLIVALCGNLSAVDVRNGSVLTLRLKNELAYLKTQNQLTTEAVSRHRTLYLEMPEQLTPEERDALEQYQQEYSRLHKALELAKAEKMFERYKRLDATRLRATAEERTRQPRLQKAPVPETKKNVIVPRKLAAAEAQRKAAAVAAERNFTAAQMRRELTALYPRAYALTSKRILVSSVKEKDKYASEFARAVKLFEDWQKKWNDTAKRKPHLAAMVKTQSAAAEQTLTLLKECQAIHEFAYKGGTKMKGVKLDRYRIVSTNWQGIDYADAGNHYQLRLKAANLNSAVKLRLIAQSARRLKKNTQSLNSIPLLAYYHLLVGHADIVARLNLTEEQKQSLVDYFKDWNLPEKEKQILVKSDKKKTEPDGNNGKVERF